MQKSCNTKCEIAIISFSVGARADTSNSNPGTGPIYFDNVECTGRELLLVNCSFRGLSVHDCSHFEDAGVHCEGQ